MLLLLVHLGAALGGIAATTVAVRNSTQRNIRLGWALTGLTFISGSALVIVSHSAILPACSAGIAYIGLNAAGLVLAKNKLSKSRIS